MLWTLIGLFYQPTPRHKDECTLRVQVDYVQRKPTGSQFLNSFFKKFIFKENNYDNKKIFMKVYKWIRKRDV